MTKSVINILKLINKY
ncbi:hypothetical protein VCHENC02_5670A, partial [Vibrio harveyi]